MRGTLKAKCLKCAYLNWDFVSDRQDLSERPYYCGLHGRAQVDPEGEQPNLDHRGSCGFCPKQRAVMRQLSLFD